MDALWSPLVTDLAFAHEIQRAARANDAVIRTPQDVDIFMVADNISGVVMTYRDGSAFEIIYDVDLNSEGGRVRSRRYRAAFYGEDYPGRTWLLTGNRGFSKFFDSRVAMEGFLAFGNHDIQP